DGHAGKITRDAYNKLFDKAFPLPTTTPTSQSNSPDLSRVLYKHAKEDEGLRETPGTASTPRIRTAILTAASWLNPDDTATAWCGCIMGLWVIEIGLTPPKSYYRAKEWSNFGTKVNSLAEARVGDIVIFSRAGGYHVAL